MNGLTIIRENLVEWVDDNKGELSLPGQSWGFKLVIYIFRFLPVGI